MTCSSFAAVSRHGASAAARLVGCGALVVTLLLAAALPARALERIIQFVSDVAVQRSGDLVVTETIEVEAEGNIIRRGIFRDFPTDYVRPDGTRVQVGFHLEMVTRNGSTENSVLEFIDNGVRIRIGNADRTIPTGRHTYVIRYRTTRQLGFFADYDELYWNVTGNGWAFPIERAEARINLPDQVPFRQSAFYTGPQGGKGRDATVVEQQPGRIVFRTTRPLPARNGLTVAAAWQKGVVEAPTPGRQMQYWLEDNRGLVVGAAGLAIVLAFYAFAWFSVGRDPPAGTIIPLFAPPQGMSPSAVRYVDRMSFDDMSFTSAIIDLGVKGHLQIVEAGGKTTLKKRAGGQPLTAEEQALLGRLFGGSGNIVLEQSNHERLQQAKTALSETLTKTYLGRQFSNNYGWSTLGLLLVIAVVGAVFVAVGSTHHYGMVATLVMIGLFGLPLFMGAAAMTFIGWQRVERGKALLIMGVVLGAAVIAPVLYFTWHEQAGVANLAMSGSLLALAGITGIGFPWLKAPSRDGRKLMDEIDGFREYLSVAEEDRLNYLNPPQKTPELFEKFLPYAIALDCQNVWAAKFAGVLAAAGTAAAAGWYVGSRDWSSDPVRFADHLGSSLASTISSSSTPPGSSSGSSGGGSSGGGGGGGGGGGW